MKRCTFLFTLVELLIVISVLLVLISLLQPSLRHALSRGREITCKSNLKTIYGGYAFYTEDSAGELPFALRYIKPVVVTWTEAIINYLIPEPLPNDFLQDQYSTMTQMHKYPKITLPFLQCPEHENSIEYRGKTFHPWVVGKIWARLQSYGAVGDITGTPNINAGLEFGPSGRNWSFNINQIPSPQGTYLLTEIFHEHGMFGYKDLAIAANPGYIVGWTGQTPLYPHGAKEYNFLYTDGHLAKEFIYENYSGDGTKPGGPWSVRGDD